MWRLVDRYGAIVARCRFSSEAEANSYAHAMGRPDWTAKEFHNSYYMDSWTSGNKSIL